MKKTIRKALAVMLASALLFCALFAAPSAGVPVLAATQTAVVTGDVVYVREGPGTSYPDKATLVYNMTVTVLDTSNSSWYKIRTPGGIEGYMYSEFLQLNPDTSTGGSVPSTTQTAAVTGSGVYVRSGPGTNYSYKTQLSKDTIVTVLDTSDSNWYKIRTANGTEGYMSSEFLEIITVTASQGSFSLPKGKTAFLSGYISNYSSYLNWRSMNTSIATVSNGFVYGAGMGQTQITGSDGYGNVICTYTIYVTAPLPAKFVYASPNNASVGANVDLVAITDTLPEKVRFVVHADGDTTYETSAYITESSAASGRLAQNNTRVWTQQVVFSKAGEYTVDVYACRKGIWSADYKTISVFVSPAQDFAETTLSEHRPSDRILRIIANWEGFCATIMDDPFASNAPTIGHGYVIFDKKDQFYDNLTEREAWAMLCDAANRGDYTTYVNKFLLSNNVKASQQNFDSMFSFSYNLGVGRWLSSSFLLRKLVLNSVDLSELDFDNNTYYGTVIEDVNVYSSISDSSPVATLYTGTAVSVIGAETIFSSTTHAVWYKISYGGGVYYIKNGYVELSGNYTRDLTYCDAVAFGSEMLEFHHAGGICLWGLLYRRLGEAKIFSFGNYDEAQVANANYKKNTYGYHYPSCIS